MKVRAGYKEGVVPASYVELLAQPPTPTISTLASDRPTSTYSNSSASLAGSIHASSSAGVGAGPGLGGKKKGPAVAPRRGARKLKYAEALYDYAAQSEAEHSIVEGERFVLINRDTGDGWADVEKEGVVRSVPASYIQEA